MKNNVAISLQKVSKRYQGGYLAVDNLSLEVKKGDFFGLLGLNGAGKTTMIRMMVGLAKPTSGTIWINGVDNQVDAFLAKQSVGMMPQELNMNAFNTVHEVMFNHGGYYGMSRSDVAKVYKDVLHKVGLSGREQMTVKALSGGMKRRLLLARSLLVKPSILVLDEPTAGVDVDLRKDIWDLLLSLNNEGVTILLTTHYMEEAEYLCKNLAILHHGKIIDQGHISQLALSNQKRQFLFHMQNNIQQVVDHAGVEVSQKDERTLSVALDQGASLSTYLQLLENNGQHVDYVSSPSNRLEQYFRAQTEN